MKLYSVAYKRLHSFGSYENECLEGTTLVPPGADPDLVLKELKTWVHERLGIPEEDVRQERDSLARDIRVLRDERRKLDSEIDQARETWRKAQAFLEKHGLDMPEHLPF